jgi:capsular polysaccharide transport system permease protein
MGFKDGLRDRSSRLQQQMLQLRGRLKPRITPLQVGVLLVVLSGIYSFVIGRPRFQSSSDFLVRQPMPPGMTAPAVVGPVLGGPSMLASLEDGRYLAVYLHSPEVMGRVFRQLLEQERYLRQRPDWLAGLPANANQDQQLAFFRRQVQVWPQELSGVIQLTTTALDAPTALQLNKLLLQEAQAFVNEMNQSISREQLKFAEQEVARARQQLDQATDRLNAFQSEFGQLDPIQESTATSGYITALEARLVELRVEEASLRRQFRDPEAPEVQFVADQVQELQRQIQEERKALVNPEGRDLSGRAAEAMKLQNEVTFATEGLKAAMLAAENSRMESQRQLKFLVLLSDPQEPALQDWNWRWQVFLGSIGMLVVVWGVSSFVLGIRRRV